jgi:hypothetical protein
MNVQQGNAHPYTLPPSYKVTSLVCEKDAPVLNQQQPKSVEGMRHQNCNRVRGSKRRLFIAINCGHTRNVHLHRLLPMSRNLKETPKKIRDILCILTDDRNKG